MGSFSIWHWLIVLVVVILIFGTKKLRNMGSDVGGAVNEFKKAINDGKASELSTEKAEIATVAVEKPKAETKVTTRKPAAKTATKSAAKPTAKAKVPTKTSTTAAKKPATKTTAKKAPAKPKLDV